MQDPLNGYIDSYPCSCSGVGDTCFIVMHPSISPPPSFPTRSEAEEVLRKVRAGELTSKDIYPNMEV